MKSILFVTFAVCLLLVPGALSAGNGYLPLTTDKSAQANKNLEAMLTDDSTLAKNSGAFLFSAINAIFGKEIEALTQPSSPPLGSHDAWQAWSEVNWLRGADWATNNAVRWPDTTTIKAALQATGQMIVDLLNTANVVSGIDKDNNMICFVNDKNPAAVISFIPGFGGDGVQYVSGDIKELIQNGISDIENGIASNDFKQVGAGFGAIVKQVLKL